MKGFPVRGLRPESRFLAQVPWPAAASLGLAHLLGWCLGRTTWGAAWGELSLRAVQEGKVWALWTGHLVQFSAPWLGVLAVLTAILFGREIETRVGWSATWLAYLACCLIASLGWLAIDGLSETLGLWEDAGMALVSYPALTLLVASMVAADPWARMEATGYRLSRLVVAGFLGFLVASWLVLAEAWPLLLSVHLFAVAAGLVVGWIVQRRSLGPDVALQGVRDLTEDELQRRLDSALARMAEVGPERLSPAERLILEEASRRARLDRPDS